MPIPASPRHVAVVHDWLVAFAGSERVLEQILALYPRATLYTLIDRMPAAERARLPSSATHTSWLQRLPKVERYFTRCLPLMPMAAQQWDLTQHDLVISSSHCAAKGVITAPDSLHLCYCHSPMRYAWDMQAQYLRTEGLERGLSSWLARALFHRLRLWDTVSANGVDHFATNSSFVQQRIRKCYRRDATVIHPPVELPAPLSTAPPREPRHLVTVGRLMGYKNIALMLEAFRLLPDHRLTVAGDGPALADLRRHAPPNVTLLGQVSEEQKWALLQGASAFVFAAVEDFGIAPVEALAVGTPVIALARGGALDYLRHRDNAWLYEEASGESLSRAVLQALENWPADVNARARASAERFGAARFRHAFSRWVDEHWQVWRASGPHP